MSPRFAGALLALAAAPFACTLYAQPADDEALERMRDRLTRMLPDVHRADITRAALPGFYEIRRGETYGYVTEDGRTLIVGDAIDLQQGRHVTDEARRARRLAAAAEAPGAIVFAARGAQPETAPTVTVFTDIDCRYCRDFHRRIEAYLEQGVGIRYLFNPSGGPGSASYRKAVRVACAVNPQQALTEAKLGQNVPEPPPGCVEPVAAQRALAETLALRATPALLLPDGTIDYGAPEPAVLAERLMPPERAPGSSAEASSPRPSASSAASRSPR